MGGVDVTVLLLLLPWLLLLLVWLTDDFVTIVIVAADTEVALLLLKCCMKALQLLAQAMLRVDGVGACWILLGFLFAHNACVCTGRLGGWWGMAVLKGARGQSGRRAARSCAGLSCLTIA